MATARVAGYTATPLADGRVLVVGGQDAATAQLATAEMLPAAELYDPETGTFGPTGSMTERRARHTATLLADGRVLVTGGFEVLTATGPSPPLASAELYDPKTGTFSTTDP